MKQESLQLTGGNFSGSRRELDFYPTPSNVTEALMLFLAKQGLGVMKIWEPACGSGAMSKVMEAHGHNVFSSDIQYLSFGHETVDYLAAAPKVNMDAIITNPPFSLAEDFIRKSVSEARVVAMLLKSQYWHASSRRRLFEDLQPSFVLPLTWRPDFLEHTRLLGEKKGAPTMEVAWTVWIKGNADTRYMPLGKPDLRGF